MKILHYSLGFPPYRTGGLTKFCMDLMIEQYRMGHQVALMWPGKMKIFHKKTVVKRRKTVVLDNVKIINFEVINPLPIPYDEGISNIKEFTRESDLEPYKEFLKQFQPDAIHLHTLMGLHKEFVSAAKEMGIRMVFTSHDLFPICPKVTMFRNGRICESVRDCSLCGSCNKTAFSMTEMIILQSNMYRLWKDTRIMRYFRKWHRNNYFKEQNEKKITVKNVEIAKDYLSLRNYYQSMLQMMDKIHYNSTVTKQVYEGILTLPEGVVIPISHLDITDHRMLKDFSGEILRIRYLGPASGAKGFFLLKDALDQLWQNRRNFRLDVHFSVRESSPYIKEHERYTPNDLKDIFYDTDVLVVPSIYPETFGFTALEALSYGVPVIMSDTVGAKDILANGAGIIIEDITAEKLCKTIDNLTVETLQQMNQVIWNRQEIPRFAYLAKLIEENCYR